MEFEHFLIYVMVGCGVLYHSLFVNKNPKYAALRDEATGLLRLVRDFSPPLMIIIFLFCSVVVIPASIIETVRGKVTNRD